MRVPANSGPRIVSSTQRTFWPTTSAAKPSPPIVRSTCVGQGVPSSSAARCTGPSPGTNTVIIPPRSMPVGLTTMVDAGGAATSAASAWSAWRTSPSPIWRASW